MGQGITHTVASFAHEAAPSQRVILIARRCMIVDSLREALTATGIEVVSARDDAPLACGSSQYDAGVIFQTRCETVAMAAIKQRLSELHAFCPGLPTVALIEERYTKTATSFGMFSTVVLGVPSVSFAIAVVRLAMLSAPMMRERVAMAAKVTEETGAVLTPRERDLLDGLRRGLPNKLIAHELGVSLSTVKTHLRNVMIKIKATNRTEVAMRLHKQPEFERITTQQAAE